MKTYINNTYVRAFFIALSNEEGMSTIVDVKGGSLSIEPSLYVLRSACSSNNILRDIVVDANNALLRLLATCCLRIFSFSCQAAIFNFLLFSFSF